MTMNRRGFGRFGAGLITMALAARSSEASVQTMDPVDPWIVYYRAEERPSAFRDYRLVVFDADRHPPLASLKARDRSLLGYLSLGEVEEGRAHFRAVEAEGLLLMRNQYWQESRMVDLRDPRWRARVLDQLVPAVLAKGFDGIFLDTLDNAAHLERLEPERFRGMTAAARDLVLAMRARFPQARIMLNRAFEILPEVEQAIDIVLGEAVYATYDFEREEYGLLRDDLNRRYVDMLKAAKARRPALVVCTLDYWDPGNPEGIARIYRVQRAHGFAPYVATIALDRIVPEPGR